MLILWSPYLLPHSVAHMVCWASIFKWGKWKLKLTDPLGKWISICFPALTWSSGKLLINLFVYFYFDSFTLHGFTNKQNPEGVTTFSKFSNILHLLFKCFSEKMHKNEPQYMYSVPLWNKDEKHTIIISIHKKENFYSWILQRD